MPKRPVIVNESGDGPYAQIVSIGHHVMRADEGDVGVRDIRTIARTIAL
jgi:hypothetical protein